MSNFHWAALTLFLLGTAGWLWGEWAGRRLKKSREAEDVAKAADVKPAE